MDQPPSTMGEPELDALCALNEPTRRRLYDHVVAASGPVTRDQASEALGLDRSLAAYHLDKLVDRGLLEVSFARPEGRGGPGAGRPAKRYERADREFSVSAPPRDYALVAEVLARAAGADASAVLGPALEQAAAEVGREVAAGSDHDAGDLSGHLTHLGFEPYTDGDVVRLRNCPFRRLARAHTELVCGLNLALLTALVGSLDVPATARLEPDPDGCCVVFEPR